MKSVYILLISTTIFEVIMLANPMPFGPKEGLPKSRYASYIKPDQAYGSDKSAAKSLPEVKYSPASQTVSNRKDQNNENIELKKNVDEDPNKIKNDIEKEMTKTRTHLKLNVENAQARMDQFLERSRNALQLTYQLEYEDMVRDVAGKIASLRNQGEVSNNEIRAALQQLRQNMFNQIRQMYIDFSKSTQLSGRTLDQLHNDFSAHLDMMVKNKLQRKVIALQELSNQFNSMVKNINTKIDQNRSQLFNLQEQNKESIRSQIDDIFNEMMQKARAVGKEMFDMFAERKQNLKDVYKKAQTMDETFAKEYVNEEMEKVTAEMNNIKAEMEHKMINEIKNIINMLRTKVETILS